MRRSCLPTESPLGSCEEEECGSSSLFQGGSLTDQLGSGGAASAYGVTKSGEILMFVCLQKDVKQCCDATTPESIHTKDESKRESAFAFIFAVNWFWHSGVTALFGVFSQLTSQIIFGKMHFLLIWKNEFFHEIKCKGMTSFMDFMERCITGQRPAAWSQVTTLWPYQV